MQDSFLSLRMNKCWERVDGRHFWTPGVFSYAMIPRCRRTQEFFFFFLSSSSHPSIVYGCNLQMLYFSMNAILVPCSVSVSHTFLQVSRRSEPRIRDVILPQKKKKKVIRKTDGGWLWHRLQMKNAVLPPLFSTDDYNYLLKIQKNLWRWSFSGVRMFHDNLKPWFAFQMWTSCFFFSGIRSWLKKTHLNELDVWSRCL
jgi:hypothetical protein